MSGPVVGPFNIPGALGVQGVHLDQSGLLLPTKETCNNNTCESKHVFCKNESEIYEMKKMNENNEGKKPECERGSNELPYLHTHVA